MSIEHGDREQRGIKRLPRSVYEAFKHAFKNAHAPMGPMGPMGLWAPAPLAPSAASAATRVPI